MAIHSVNAGGNLQDAINQSAPGDIITVEAGAVFGPITLPERAEYVTIRPRDSAITGRISPERAALLWGIASGSGGPAITGHGAKNWRIEGCHARPNVDGAGTVVELDGATNIQIVRLLLNATQGQRRGILGNGRSISLEHSHIAGCWAPTLQDSQAFCAYDGPGPYVLNNNYLEAASENVLFGGADSVSPDGIPSDITIVENTFSKNPDWRGQPRGVKNLFELKCARRVIVRRNIFEHCWPDAQSGSAIVFTVRNQDGTAPWSVVEDVTFESNTVTLTEHGFNLLGYDDEHPSGRTTRISIRNNLVFCSGVFFKAGGEVGDVTIENNTVENGYTFMMLYRGGIRVGDTTRAARYAIQNLTVLNNLGYHNDYGVWGEEAPLGGEALRLLTESVRWDMNALAGGPVPGPFYPIQTLRPTVEIHRAQFDADYGLNADSMYRSVGVGGVDLGRLTTVPEPPPPPPPTGDQIAPEVRISSIRQNGKSHNYSVAVVASDTEGVDSVTIKVNGSIRAFLTAPPFNASVALRGAGSYTVSAEAIDANGNIGTASRTVVISGRAFSDHPGFTGLRHGNGN